MRAFLAALVLALVLPSSGLAHEPATHVAQMARDVTDAVRRQRAERRARPHQDQRPTEGTKR